VQLGRIAALGLFATFLACTGSSREAPAREALGSNDETPPFSAPGPTRAQMEEVADIAQPEPPDVAVQHEPRQANQVRLEISDADAERGEDGRGRVVPATDPVYVDLVRAGGFPGRARDPELHVGQLRFTRYSHPAPDRMRFVVADRALLGSRTDVALTWGTDRMQLRDGE
jgi:hypothetical protein